MRNTLCLIITLGLLLIFTSSCHRERNRVDFNRLEKLDSMLADSPQAVMDSIGKINPNKLSRFNRGYFQVLEMTARDKNYFNFTSDSLAENSVRLLGIYKQKHPRLYARSLMYLGIVRYRMGITDSTAYLPIREAVGIWDNEIVADDRNKCQAAQYLGVLHDINENYEQAFYYFSKALQSAQITDDDKYIFFNLHELAWNRLKANDMPQAKHYIHLIEAYGFNNATRENDYDKLLAYYYYHSQEYERSLEIELKLYNKGRMEGAPDNYKKYFKLYSLYNALNDYENAYHFLKLALARLDSVEHLNYMIYADLGKLAGQMRLRDEEAYAYKTAYNLLNSSVKKHLDKKLLELEKKYDYSSVELTKLKAEKRLYVVSAISVIAILMFIILFFVYRRIMLQKTNILLLAENENIKLEIKNERLLYKNKQKEWSTELLLFIAHQQEVTDKLLYKISINREVQGNVELTDIIANEKKKYNIEKKKLVRSLTESNIFFQICGLTAQEASTLNNNERMLLALFACGFSKEKIALMLSSTAESVRVRLTNLQKKTASLGIKPNCFL